MSIDFKSGVKECWITHMSERAVERYAFSDGEPTRLSKSTESERITTPVLPDWNLSAENIFA
jgi:Uma2 family endonuclease